MKSYRDLEKLEKAFFEFIRVCNLSKLMRVQYYQGRKSKTDYSFIGKITIDDGRYGIHYNKQRCSYEFGTRGINGDSYIESLTYPQEAKIPGYIKDALKEVADTKKLKVINAPLKQLRNLNEWK